MRTLTRTSLFLLFALASAGARHAQAAPRGPLGVGMKVSSATASPGADVVVPLGAHVAVAVFGTVFPDSDGWATTPTIELRPFPGRRATAFAFAGPRFERHAWRRSQTQPLQVV